MINLETVTSAFGTITVSRRKSTNSIVYDLNGRGQSEVDANGVSLAYYIHAIFGLLMQTDARSILMVGCGGGTLATMLYRAGRSVEIIDVDPNSFSLAKDYFSLPSDIPCHVGDGKEFLRSHQNKYDAIVLDAFLGSEIPDKHLTAQFFNLVKSRINAGGVVFGNVLLNDDYDYCADNIANIMSSFFDDVRILDTIGVRDRNAIVMAGAVRYLYRPDLLMRPNITADFIQGRLEDLAFRPRRGAFLLKIARYLKEISSLD